jgi:hypothetical protein
MFNVIKANRSIVNSIGGGLTFFSMLFFRNITKHNDAKLIDKELISKPYRIEPPAKSGRSEYPKPSSPSIVKAYDQKDCKYFKPLLIIFRFGD